jgi:hypothetical protein
MNRYGVLFQSKKRFGFLILQHNILQLQKRPNFQHTITEVKFWCSKLQNVAKFSEFRAFQRQSFFARSGASRSNTLENSWIEMIHKVSICMTIRSFNLAEKEL